MSKVVFQENKHILIQNQVDLIEKQYNDHGTISHLGKYLMH